MSVWVNSNGNQTLPSIDSTANWASWEYKHLSSDTTNQKEIFDAWNPSSSSWADANNNFAVQVDVNENSNTFNEWSDYGSNQPTNIVLSNGQISLYHTNGDLLYKFTKPTSASWITSPTITSITEDKIFVPSDTVSVTDFTLKQNDQSYSTSNISLTGPSLLPPSDARGYEYELTTNTNHETALYEFTIDSKSYISLIYNDSWTSSASSGRTTNSNRILNVMGKIPTTTSMTITNNIQADNLNWYEIRRSNRFIEYAIGASWDNNYLNAPNERFGFFVDGQNNEIVGTFYYYKKDDVVGTYTESSTFEIGAQQTMSYTTAGLTVEITDWIYNEPEGDGYVPTTSNNNSGKPRDGYPIVMTNLFNRNRSIYSIGMTHKTAGDPFI